MRNQIQALIAEINKEIALTEGYHTKKIQHGYLIAAKYALGALLKYY